VESLKIKRTNYAIMTQTLYAEPYFTSFNEVVVSGQGSDSQELFPYRGVPWQQAIRNVHTRQEIVPLQEDFNPNTFQQTTKQQVYLNKETMIGGINHLALRLMVTLTNATASSTTKIVPTFQHFDEITATSNKEELFLITPRSKLAWIGEIFNGFDLKYKGKQYLLDTSDAGMVGNCFGFLANQNLSPWYYDFDETIFVRLFRMWLAKTETPILFVFQPSSTIISSVTIPPTAGNFLSTTATTPSTFNITDSSWVIVNDKMPLRDLKWEQDEAAVSRRLYYYTNAQENDYPITYAGGTINLKLFGFEGCITELQVFILTNSVQTPSSNANNMNLRGLNSIGDGTLDVIDFKKKSILTGQDGYLGSYLQTAVQADNTTSNLVGNFPGYYQIPIARNTSLAAKGKMDEGLLFVNGENNWTLEIIPAVPVNEKWTVQKFSGGHTLGTGFVTAVLSNGTIISKSVPMAVATTTPSQMAVALADMTWAYSKNITATVTAPGYTDVTGNTAIFNTTDSAITITFTTPMTAGLQDMKLSFECQGVTNSAAALEQLIAYRSIQGIAGLQNGSFTVYVVARYYYEAYRSRFTIGADTVWEPLEMPEELARQKWREHRLDLYEFPRGLFN
jgi:hypothetical protein